MEQAVPGASPLLAPIVQWGFAGFCGLLIGIIVWLINKLLGVLKDTNSVVSQNTSVIAKLTDQSADELRILRELHNKLIARPCIARREGSEEN